MAVLNNSNAISSGGYDINNSLRLRSSASAYLNRTPASAGNRQIMTYSFWVKRGAISGDYNLTNATTDASNSATFYFNSSNNQTFDVFLRVAGTNYSVATSQVFRDPSAWYHIVIAIDTTQATASNRTKVYVNGSQVTNFLTANYVPQNSNLALNNNVAQYIGFSNYFDGYLADVNFINGSQKAASDFGETDTTTGVWKPKAYTGTYGTNGFYLKFSDIATTSGSNAGLGKDFSGNANYWTTNNISVTAGTTYDAMTDVPTLTSATVANYAVLNPLNLASSGVTSTNANLLATSTGAAYRSLTSTIDLPTGSWYFEITAGASSAGDNVIVGIQSVTENLQSNYVGSSATSYGYASGGKKYNAGTGVAYGATWTSGDVIGIAFNGSTLTFYKNNTSQGNAYTGLSGNFVFSVSAYTSSASVNFGQRPFTYTPPTGYLALNTFNLPNSTIKKGNTVMDATTYTGNSSTQTITNAGAFKPDLVWLKCRSTTGTWNNFIDSIRGTSKTLYSNTTNAEGTDNYLSAFNSNGFGLNVGDSGSNTFGNTYVGWQWQAGQGTTTTGTGTGGITSVTQSVNTTAGFSIVTYTGSGANGTVTHGLGVAPKMIILKNRGAVTNWKVWQTSLAGTEYLEINTTAAKQTAATVWNSTVPSSTVFSIGTSGDVNTNTGTYVAYCWAEISGYSKFGSYTGNGSTDGTFVYTGFRPKYVLLKSTGVENWFVFDSSRNTYNVTTARLYPALSNAEDTNLNTLDLLSNGFKFRDTNAAWNSSGQTYIYACFAENPFKNSLAR